MPELADLLDGVRKEPSHFGLGTSAARLGGKEYYWARERFGVAWVPDVIGQVKAYGRVCGPRRDPWGTLRVERAWVSGVLHLSHHLADSAWAIRNRYPDAQVRVGEAVGLPWLDEIAAAEGVVEGDRAWQRA
jgi:hypothetical protein